MISELGRFAIKDVIRTFDKTSMQQGRPSTAKDRQVNKQIQFSKIVKMPEET